MSDTDFFDDDLVKRPNGRSSFSHTRETGSVGPYNDSVGNPVSDLNLTRMAKQREDRNIQLSSVAHDLEQLRRRQSDLERERQLLESLTRKQDDYERGKAEVLDRLNQSVIALEKQEARAVRQVEVFSSTRQRFLALLKELEGIDDSAWTEQNLREELSRAVAVIESARQEYTKGMATVDATSGEPIGVPELMPSGSVLNPEKADNFVFWLKAGMAFMIPLGVLIIIVGLVAAWIARGH